MRHKPWPIILLSLLQIVTPIGSMALNMLYHHLPFRALGPLLSHFSWLQIWEIFGLMPLAGWALLQVKPWSYPVLVAALLWNAFSNLRNAFHSGGILAFALVFFFLSLNLLLIGYFSLPEIRRLYLDRRLRWWETKKRYRSDIRAEASRDDREIPVSVTVTNLSVGGSCFEGDWDSALLVGDQFKIRFTLLREECELWGEIVHIRKTPAGRTCAGTKWIFESKPDRVRIENLIAAFAGLLPAEKNPEPTGWKALWAWFATQGAKAEGWYLTDLRAKLRGISGRKRPSRLAEDDSIFSFL